VSDVVKFKQFVLTLAQLRLTCNLLSNQCSVSNTCNKLSDKWVHITWTVLETPTVSIIYGTLECYGMLVGL